MTEQLTLLDGRDALAVVIVRATGDPRRPAAEVQSNGIDRRSLASVLYQVALDLRDRAEQDPTPDTPKEPQ